MAALTLLNRATFDRQLNAQINRGFIERRRHPQAVARLDGLDELSILVLRKLRIERLLDVPDVGPIPEILVNKAIHIPELELYGRLDAVEPSHLRSTAQRTDQPRLHRTASPSAGSCSP